VNSLKPIRFHKLKPCSAFLIGIFVFHSAFAASDEEQVLSRITALWKDKQTHLVKAQAKSFFENYPESKQKHLVQIACAYAEREEGNFKLAKEILQSIEPSYQNEEISFLLIDCLYQLKNYSEAATACRTILEKNPADKQTLYAYLGLSLLQKSKEEKAVNGDLENTCELKAALDALEKSSSSSFKSAIGRSKVEILRLLKEHKKASILAEELSVHDRENSESLLFIAALEAVHFDANKSLALFEKIAQSGSALAGSAAHNWMIGLIKEKRFKDFIENRAAIKKHLNKKQEPLFHFYLAEASFHTQDFSKAQRLLQEVPDTLEGSQKKRALILTAFCADKTNNAPLLKKTALKLINAYPEDKQTLDVLMLYARQCQKEGLFEEAKKALATALKQNISLEKRQPFELFSLCLDYQTGGFEQVLNRGLMLFESQLNTPQDSKAFLELMAAAALKLRTPLALKTLNALLDKAYNSSVIIPTSFSLGYAELLVENKAYENARAFLEKEIDDLVKLPINASNQVSKSQVLSDLSELYEALGKTYSLEYEAQKRSHFLELALKNNPYENQEKKLPIFLDLFNAYRKLYVLGEALDPSHEKKGELPLDLAANALFSAFQIAPQTLSLQNKQWLAELYFEQVENASNSHFKAPLVEPAFTRSCALYKALTQDESHPNDLRAQNLMRLAKLIMLNDSRSSYSSIQFVQRGSQTPNFTEALSLLKKALELIEKSSEEKAPLIQGRILVDMGRCFEKDKSYAEAKKCYEQVISIMKLSQAADEARLQLCRLKLREGTEHLNDVIATLKDLQLKKSLDHEPIFLEAAIDYIDASCLGLEPSIRDEKRLFLLERMEEDFWNTTGALAEHYHKRRKQAPNQDKIFLAYMQYVELQLQFLKAKNHLTNKAERLEALRNLRVDVTKKMPLLTSCTEYLETKTHFLLGLIDDATH